MAAGAFMSHEYTLNNRRCVEARGFLTWVFGWREGRSVCEIIRPSAMAIVAKRRDKENF